MNESNLVALRATCDDSLMRATALAQALGLPFSTASNAANYRYILNVDVEKLSLSLAVPQKASQKVAPLTIDFLDGQHEYRRLHGGGKSQMIAKAVGLSKGMKPTVMDCTAGLGRDAFVLASLGCCVLMLERHPVVHVLLEDGLRRARAQADGELAAIVSRLTLARDDAREYLRRCSEDERPDIIYLDPMFPPRDKSAQVKKEMQFFHDLVGLDGDADDLISLARAHANYRVVVKRPRRAPTLGVSEPSYALSGKSSRFDIYVNRKMT